MNQLYEQKRWNEWNNSDENQLTMEWRRIAYTALRSIPATAHSRRYGPKII